MYAADEKLLTSWNQKQAQEKRRSGVPTREHQHRTQGSQNGCYGHGVQHGSGRASAEAHMVDEIVHSYQLCAVVML